MNKLIIGVFVLASMGANADLVKIDGYLKYVDPTTGKINYVQKHSGALVNAEGVEIISANLVKEDGYLKSVDPVTGKINYVQKYNGDLVPAAGVSTN